MIGPYNPLQVFRHGRMPTEMTHLHPSFYCPAFILGRFKQLQMLHIKKPTP